MKLLENACAYDVIFPAPNSSNHLTPTDISRLANAKTWPSKKLCSHTLARVIDLFIGRAQLAHEERGHR